MNVFRWIVSLLGLAMLAAPTLRSEEVATWPFSDGSRLESILGYLRVRLYAEAGFSSLPKGVTLALEADPDPEAEGWFQVVLREFHTEDSGFDPNVAPAIAHFYVRESDGRIEWYDLPEDKRRPLEDFIKDRKTP